MPIDSNHDGSGPSVPFQMGACSRWETTRGCDTAGEGWYVWSDVHAGIGRAVFEVDMSSIYATCSYRAQPPIFVEDKVVVAVCPLLSFVEYVIDHISRSGAESALRVKKDIVREFIDLGYDLFGTKLSDS
jgi:hypothetical protein